MNAIKIETILALLAMLTLAPGALTAGSSASQYDAIAAPRDKPVVNIGSRLELFVDNFMIDSLTGGAERRLHHPVPREIVMRFGDEGTPWEGNVAYLTAIRDADRVLLYYSARVKFDYNHYRNRARPKDKPITKQYACVLVSSDGIRFQRPELGIHDISRFFPDDVDVSRNNVVWPSSAAAHNFTPFLDTRPGVSPADPAAVAAAV